MSTTTMLTIITIGYAIVMIAAIVYSCVMRNQAEAIDVLRLRQLEFRDQTIARLRATVDEQAQSILNQALELDVLRDRLAHRAVPPSFDVAAEQAVRLTKEAGQ